MNSLVVYPPVNAVLASLSFLALLASLPLRYSLRYWRPYPYAIGALSGALSVSLSASYLLASYQ